jgi:hypothetical protein
MSWIRTADPVLLFRIDLIAVLSFGPSRNAGPPALTRQIIVKGGVPGRPKMEISILTFLQFQLSLLKRRKAYGKDQCCPVNQISRGGIRWG